MPNEPSNPTTPASFVRVEAAALTALAQRLDTTMLAPFTQAIDRILASQSEKSNRVIVTGIGKSGIIARKLAATLRSTGSPAHFLHPTEAVHGDIGLIAPGDTVLALSYSVVKSVLNDPIFYTSVDVARIAGFMADSSLKILTQITLALLVVAAIEAV